MCWLGSDRVSALDNVTEAKVVKVEPGDVIFLRVEGQRISPDIAKAIKEQAKAIWPDNEIVVGAGVDVAIVRPSDGAA